MKSVTRFRSWQFFGALFSMVVLIAVARPAKAQTYTVLHSFAGYPTDGAIPNGELVQDSAGNLYGTTYSGGTGGGGTVFKRDAAGNVTILYSFTNSDVLVPRRACSAILTGLFMVRPSQAEPTDSAPSSS